MRRSRNMKWVSIFMAAFVAAGCSPQGQAGNPVSTDGKSAEPKVELSFSVNTPLIDESKKVWEEIVSEYTKNKPNTKIKLDYAPKADDTTSLRPWITTSLIGGTSPDIFPTRYTWVHEDLRKDTLLDLTSYYDKANPYNGDKVWKTTFAPAIINELAEPGSGKLAGVSTSTTAVRVFYNMDIFKKLNLTVPRTWDDFLVVQKKLKDSGVVPFAFANSKPGDSHFLWTANMMTNQLVAQKMQSYDWDKNKQLSVNEMVASVDENSINLASPEWNAIFPIIKDWSQYWAKGYNALSSDAAIESFLRGDTAMTFAIINSLKTIHESSARKFEYGTFPLPYLTKQQIPNASETNHELGGYPDGMFAIPKNIADNKKQAAVDFLMYLSSPKVAGIMGNKLYLATTLSGVELPSNLSGFQFAGERILVNIYAANFDKRLNEGLTQYGQLYLEGNSSMEKYTTELQKLLTDASKAMMTNNGWNKENKYGTQK